MAAAVTTSFTVPDEVADKIQKIRRRGYEARIEPAPDLDVTRIGACRACDTSNRHKANVIVNVIYGDQWTFPVERLEGEATPCCWDGLADHLDDVEHRERFDSVQIEVPL